MQAHRDLEAAQDDRVVDLRHLSPADPYIRPSKVASHHEQGEQQLTTATAPHRPSHAGLDQGRTADLHDRRRTCATSTWATPRATTTSSPRSARCCCSTRCCSSATRTSPAPSTSPSRARFGELEDHPVAGSDPDHPGLVRIYKTPDSAARALRERLAHRRHLARDAAVRLRAALRRMPAGRRRHDVGQHGRGLRAACPSTSRRRSPACARATASRPASAPRCRSKSGSR